MQTDSEAGKRMTATEIKKRQDAYEAQEIERMARLESAYSRYVAALYERLTKDFVK